MFRPELLDRTKAFAIAVIRLHNALPRRSDAWTLGRQLLRSGTSIGANYRESQRSRSSLEFISKVHIALQEAEETCYWLELLVGAGIVANEVVGPLLQESTELCAILSAVIRSAEESMRRGRS